MKILIIIAQFGFRDEELDMPMKHYSKNGISVEIASEKVGECIGKLGMRINASKGFDDIIKIGIDKYAAIMLVGGPGSQKLVGNKKLEEILHMFRDKNKLIASICYSPVILARAGLLKGKSATVWNNDGLEAPILKQEGATFIDKRVVVDKMLVTGNGPEAALEFAQAVVKELNIE